MTLTLILEPEKVIADYLREQPDVVAITDRIVTKTPKSTDDPWVRYTVLNADSVGGHRSDHLIEAYLQMDCYAGREGGQPQASLLARTVRAALVALNGEAEVDGAVVTGAKPRGYSRQPDIQLDHRERFIVSFSIWMHP